MKRIILTTVLFTTLATSGLNAQITHGSLPGFGGDRYIGVELGVGGAFSTVDCILSGKNNASNSYYGFEATNMKRGFSPTISLISRRNFEGNTVNWGSCFGLSYNRYNGTVEGESATGSSTINGVPTFTTKYNFATVSLDCNYYLMVPVADEQFSINVGLGSSMGLTLSPKSTIEYTNYGGKDPVSTVGSVDIFNLICFRIGGSAGVDYHVSDNIMATFLFTAYPIDFFRFFKEGNTGYINVGDGLLVNHKTPWKLTLGCYYYID